MQLDTITTVRLREVLCRYLGSQDLISVVCHDAGVERSRVNLSTTPELAWQQVIEEADRHGAQQLERLLDACVVRAPALETEPVIVALMHGGDTAGRTPTRVVDREQAKVSELAALEESVDGPSEKAPEELRQAWLVVPTRRHRSVPPVKPPSSLRWVVALLKGHMASRQRLKIAAAVASSALLPVVVGLAAWVHSRVEAPSVTGGDVRASADASPSISSRTVGAVAEERGVALYVEVLAAGSNGSSDTTKTHEAVREALQRLDGAALVSVDQDMVVMPDAVAALRAVRPLFADVLLKVPRDGSSAPMVLIGVGSGSFSYRNGQLAGEAPDRARRAATEPLVAYVGITQAILLDGDLFAQLSDETKEMFGIATIHHPQLGRDLYTVDPAPPVDETWNDRILIKASLADPEMVYIVAAWVPSARLKRAAGSGEIKERMSKISENHLVPLVESHLVDVAVLPRLLLFNRRADAVRTATALVRATRDTTAWDEVLDVHVGIALHVGSVTLAANSYSGPDLKAASALAGANVSNGTLVLSEAFYRKLGKDSKLRVRAVATIDKERGRFYYYREGGSP